MIRNVSACLDTQTRRRSGTREALGTTETSRNAKGYVRVAMRDSIPYQFAFAVLEELRVARDICDDQMA